MYGYLIKLCDDDSILNYSNKILIINSEQKLHLAINNE